ncbi:MAG: CpsD/CapB family tyrosine-protein kinase [Bacillus sp. (in: firmicutes)]
MFNKIKRSKKQTLLDNRRKLIARYNPKSPISEQYRTIRTNIQFAAVDKEIRTLMVSSSNPGEGKSTTAANLAVVFAQQGKKVLLIDADMRKPTVHYTFNMTNTFGLTSVLTRKAAFRDTVQQTEDENLSVLSSGPIPPNPAELIGSKMMTRTIEEMKNEFDLIIFDTPPILAVADAQIIARTCDGAVLVVGCHKTENDQAVKAKGMLHSAGAKLLGAVLNQKKMASEDQYYYYGVN